MLNTKFSAPSRNQTPAMKAVYCGSVAAVRLSAATQCEVYRWSTSPSSNFVLYCCFVRHAATNWKCGGSYNV